MAYDRAAMTREICDDIASGLSARKACAKDGRPGITTFMRWLDEDQEGGELRAQYARARDLQADHYADEIVEITDTEPDPARARVRMDARRWVASKLLPKKYGDRIEHTGAGGAALIPDSTAGVQRMAHAMLLMIETAAQQAPPAVEDEG